MAGLRARAARNGRSVEDEAREILYRALGRAEAPRDLSAAFRTWFSPKARADMALPPREPIPDPPSFDWNPPTVQLENPNRSTGCADPLARPRLVER